MKHTEYQDDVVVCRAGSGRGSSRENNGDLGGIMRPPDQSDQNENVGKRREPDEQSPGQPET